MAAPIIKSLLGNLGDKYSYASGDTTWTTDPLGDFEYVSLFLEVGSVSSTNSTFLIETSIDGGNNYVPVEHSDLTAGVLSIPAGDSTYVFRFQPWNDTNLRVTFTQNTDTGSVNNLTYNAKVLN